MGTNRVRKLDLKHGVFSQSLYSEHFVVMKNPPV
jgi:hypothetical protein